MAIFQYGSIWFNMCIYNISWYIIYIIQVLFTHEATPNDMAEVQQSIDLGLAPHARSAQSVPSVWRCSHLVEDGVRKTGQVQILKKNKKYDHGPVKSSEYRWWMVMVSQLSPSWAWESGRLWRINPVHNGAHGGHMGSPLSCLFTWRSWARYSQSSCSKVSMPTIFHQHCVLFHPKKSMPLSTGGDLWTKIHLKKSHLAQGPEASS